MGGQSTEPKLLPTGKNAKELARDGERIPDWKGGGRWCFGGRSGGFGRPRLEVSLSKLMIACNGFEMEKIFLGGNGGSGGRKLKEERSTPCAVRVGSSIPKRISHPRPHNHEMYTNQDLRGRATENRRRLGASLYTSD